MEDNTLIQLNINENNLIHALEIWFESIEDEHKTNKNFWARNKVAALLKQRLKQMNKWKNSLRSQRKPRNCDFKKKEIKSELSDDVSDLNF